MGFLKIIMSEQKLTLPSFKKSELEKVKVEIIKVNTLLRYIPTNNTKLNEIIYAEVNVFSDKICIFLRNPNINTQPACEMRIEG